MGYGVDRLSVPGPGKWAETLVRLPGRSLLLGARGHGGDRSRPWRESPPPFRLASHVFCPLWLAGESAIVATACAVG